MRFCENKNYPAYRAIVVKLGNMMYNVTGSEDAKYEIEECITELLDVAYEEGLKAGANSAATSAQEIVDRHFQRVINQFR